MSENIRFTSSCPNIEDIKLMIKDHLLRKELIAKYMQDIFLLTVVVELGKTQVKYSFLFLETTTTFASQEEHMAKTTKKVAKKQLGR